MSKLTDQVAIVTQAAKRLPLKKDQRRVLSDAILTLQKLDNLRTKIVSLEPSEPTTDAIAEDLLDLLGLEASPVVKEYGDGKHAPVPQG